MTFLIFIFLHFDDELWNMSTCSTIGEGVHALLWVCQNLLKVRDGFADYYSFMHEWHNGFG